MDAAGALRGRSAADVTCVTAIVEMAATAAMLEPRMDHPPICQGEITQLEMDQRQMATVAAVPLRICGNVVNAAQFPDGAQFGFIPS